MGQISNESVAVRDIEMNFAVRRCELTSIEPVWEVSIDSHVLAMAEIVPRPEVFHVHYQRDA